MLKESVLSFDLRARGEKTKHAKKTTHKVEIES